MAEQQPPIDVPSLLERCLNDPKFVKIVLAKFQSQAATLMSELNAGVHSRDAEQTRKIAHTLKGAAANLSAERLKSIAARLEELGKAADFATVETALNEFKEEMDRCIAFVPQALANAEMK